MIDLFSKKLIKMAPKFRSLTVLDARDSLTEKMNFLRAFSDRYLVLNFKGDTALGQAAGFVLTEKLPVLMAKASGFLNAIEIIQSILCEPNLNVKLVGVGDEQVVEIMRTIPGLKVMVPSTEEEVGKAVEAMLAHYGPTYLHLI